MSVRIYIPRDASALSLGAEAVAAAIAAEAQRLRDWIAADQRHVKTLITPRFRTPLERELAG